MLNVPSRILFVAAHCDDIELMAGGLLSRACSSGCQVGVLVFSDHRGVIDDEGAAQALAEFRENIAWLRTESGADVIDHCGRMLPACRGAFESERQALYAMMEGLRDDYDMVVTHAPSDTNQDHRQVALEASRVFKAHTSLLGGEFPSNDLGSFRPQVCVSLPMRDIEAKVRMIENYRSQDFGGRPYLDGEVARSLARVRGAQIREPFAEAFSVVGRLILR